MFSIKPVNNIGCLLVGKTSIRCTIQTLITSGFKTLTILYVQIKNHNTIKNMIKKT